MMLGVSGLMGSSGDGAAAAETHESGGASGGSSEVGGASSSIPGGGMEESGGGGGGNRWPRQETLALLKIRSDMDGVFRDSSLKGPLWDEVSRKLAELGFQRSAKKCKEKFENVYKYHKRTKDGRTSKPDGKSYRFFDQLEALENTPPAAFTPPLPPPTATTMAAPPVSSMPPNITVSSASLSPTPLTIIPPSNQINSSLFQQSQPQPINTSIPPQTHNLHHSNPHISTSLLSNSTSSSTSSDEDIQRRRGRKRKWKDYFERLMKDVVHKQEELQKKFLDTLEKRERERATRDEAWRVQEMARMNREHELLVQERSISAAKDAAVIAFLQKVTDQQTLQIPMITNNNNNNIAVPPPLVPVQVRPPPENPKTPRQPPPTPPPQPVSQQQQQTQTQTTTPPPPPQASPLVLSPPAPPAKRVVETTKTDNNGGGDNFLPPSSSRWPKAEVQALINLRTSLDLKYQDNGPKGPLWEEISSAMAKLGYNRSTKRCKEKWENINKYYKKVKESNKKRPEDSKTCPYFHQLEAIYKDKAKNDVTLFSTTPYGMKPENPMVPIMARPEQQWPMPGQQENEDEEEGDEDEDDDDEDEGGGFEVMANKQSSS